MKRDLVEGYLYEVTKSLPRKERSDVYENLELEINEKIELRKESNIETKEEVLSVLEEYGNPAEVAARYSHSRKKALVPQPHFSGYSRNKFISFFSTILVLGGIYLFNYFFINTFPITVDFVLEVLATVGIAFAIIYITYTLAFSWVSGSRLPNWNRYSKGIKPEPTKQSRVSVFEIVFQVILSTLLFVVIGLGRDLLGINIENFDLIPNIVIPFMVIIVAAYFINVINIAYKEIDRRYTLGVLFSTILTNLLVMGIAFYIFVMENSISQNFTNWLAGMLPENTLITNLVNNFGLVVFLIIALFAVIDIITTALGYHNNKKDSVEPIFREERIFADVDEIHETSGDFKDDSYHNISDTPVDTIEEEVVLEEGDPNNVHTADDRIIDEDYGEENIADSTTVDRYSDDREVDSENMDNTLIINKDEFRSAKNSNDTTEEVIIVDEPVYTEEDIIDEEEPILIDTDSTTLEDEDFKNKDSINVDSDSVIVIDEDDNKKI